MKELVYINDVVTSKNKICGDGFYTKESNLWIEQNTKCKKALLTTSCSHALDMATILCDIKEGDEVIIP